MKKGENHKGRGRSLTREDEEKEEKKSVTREGTEDKGNCNTGKTTREGN